MTSEKSKRKNNDLAEDEASRIQRDVWFYLLALVLIAIAVIVMMALTGPKIGNIFSNISYPLIRATP